MAGIEPATSPLSFRPKESVSALSRAKMVYLQGFEPCPVGLQPSVLPSTPEIHKVMERLEGLEPSTQPWQG